MKRLVLSVILMIFLTGRSFGDSTEFEGKILTHDTGISVFDSTVSQSPFTGQEFKYHAPRSATVFLIWKTDNFSLEESVLILKKEEFNLH